jgi:tRNA-dihydrouridine synthase A
MPEKITLNHRFTVAPMMDWTDRHCRFFHRLLSRHALLYSEMVTTGALIHGNQARHLDFNEQEHPVALQVGGSEPADLASVTKLAHKWGYDEINLNCGCPSERVQRGSFGACLMAEPQLVADCVKAMTDASPLPVTVKHRIGLDKNESYQFVADFVGQVAQAGCSVFIVHARNAWLKGLSPKENREVPPLRYDFVHQLKKDFKSLRFVLNGGLTQYGVIEQALEQGLDGVMIGRHAYHDPYWLAQADQRLFNASQAMPSRESVARAMIDYTARQIAKGVPARSVSRHFLGLFNGLPRARLWRQQLSDPKAMDRDAIGTMNKALDIVLGNTVTDKFNQGVWAEPD